MNRSRGMTDPSSPGPEVAPPASLPHAPMLPSATDTALSVFALLIVLLLNRYLASGLEAGAVTGEVQG